ncbi:MAG: TetR/AcrR family transcriptional regulator [Alphaproteobacteria bacterium]|nr:MAG: TetR/AcrR family transcriptional regulator [Alphaproteobacteria bacterium]
MARTIAPDHAEKRAAILKAAAHLFAREGYDRASMAALARACGISKANIYHYWGGKEALLFDVLDSHLSNLRARILSVEPDPADPEAALRRAVREILFAYKGMDDEHRLQANAMGALPEEQQAILRGYQRDMVRHMGRLIRDAVGEGLGADPVRLRGVTMSVFGMLNWFYMWNPGADDAARAAYADLVCDLTLRGAGAVQGGAAMPAEPRVSKL